MTDQPKQIGGGRKMFGDFAHVTLYAGWPKGMSAMGVAKQLFADNK
jgi:alkylhydroperoxidase/carboxymuconolactone decarboxylase family protein YurZ